MASRSSSSDLEIAHFLQEVFVHFGQLQLFDFEHLELYVERLASGVLRWVRPSVNATFADRLSPAFTPSISLSNSFNSASPKLKTGRIRATTSSSSSSQLAFVGRLDVQRQVVARLGSVFGGYQLGVAGQHLFELLGDVLFGELTHGPLT